MSAWICNKSHIACIAQFAENTDAIPRDYADVVELANDLIRENARSIVSRYGEDANMGVVKPFKDATEVLQFAREDKMSALQIIKSVHCLDYQSCESDDWNETKACKALKYIEGRAVSALPGYDEADWGIQDKQSNMINLMDMAGGGKKKKGRA
jgi:hypothetical protein